MRGRRPGGPEQAPDLGGQAQIASPAFIVTKAADEFKDKTTAPNQLWQTDFTCLKVIENHYLPGDLEAQIKAFVADYNNLRYHDGIGNLTPADVYFGRGQTLLIEREGSNARQLPIAACCTNGKPHNITSQASQELS